MDLTARDIHEKLFHDAWRGYNQEEVDDFLDRVAEVLDRVQRENEILQKRVAELDSAVAASRDTEEMLKKTLVSAQQAAEEAIATAKAKASDLITEAEARARRSIEEADERVQTAEAEARRKTLEAEREHERRRAELDANIERLQGLENELKSRIKGFLDMQAQALQGLEIVGPPPEILGPAGTPSAGEAAAEPPESGDAPQEASAPPETAAPAGGDDTAEPPPEATAPESGSPGLVDDSTAAETAARVVTLPDASGTGGDRHAEAGHGRRGMRGLLWRDEG
ncbi:MAG: DivIVA domain-containing protein [Actinomycetota bacterium]|nr:DivIVA domain-containing protein [Actinomycetota bacterium]